MYKVIPLGDGRYQVSVGFTKDMNPIFESIKKHQRIDGGVSIVIVFTALPIDTEESTHD